MKRYLKFSVSLATMLFCSFGAIAFSFSSLRADEILVNDAMLDRCDAEGISDSACVCWFETIMEGEDLDSISEEDVDYYADAYQEELAGCIEANE